MLATNATAHVVVPSGPSSHNMVIVCRPGSVWHSHSYEQDVNAVAVYIVHANSCAICNAVVLLR